MAYKSSLPLALQDLCLIRIINDLDSYPVEWLASLPRHLRYRLLHNLPVYDVCLLNHTPVTEGIDVNQILSYGLTQQQLQINQAQHKADFFMSGIRYLALPHVHDQADVDLDPELLAAYNDQDTVKQVALQAFWSLLSCLQLPTYMSIFQYLLSVKGHKFLQDTVQLAANSNIQNQSWGGPGNPISRYHNQLAMYENYYQLWIHSASGLSVFRSAGVGNDTHGHTQLVPRHLLPIYQRGDPLEMINLIVIKGGLHPVNVSVNVANLHKARFALRIKGSKQFFQQLFSKIVVLALKNISSEYQNTVQDIMETVIGNGKNCTLKSLEIVNETPMITIGAPFIPKGMHLEFLSPYLLTQPCDGPNPPCYQQLSVLELGTAIDESSFTFLTALLEQQITLKHVRLGLLDSCKPQGYARYEEKLYSLLLTLFDRENFQTLRIHFACRKMYRQVGFRSDEHHSYHLVPLVKILQSLLIVQCVNNKILYFESMCASPYELGILPPSNISEADVSIPDCGILHKNLCYDYRDFNFIASHLLQLPVIRLRELVFNLTRQTQPLFSRLTEHPNLKVGKVVLHVDFGRNDKLASTLTKTLDVLFRMPTLNEISLSVDWMHYSNIKGALVAGLQQQSQICSLRKIHLLDNKPMCVELDRSEFGELWEAIFSYPLLDQLELVLGNSLSFAAVKLAQAIHKCWENSQALLSKKKLKVLQLKATLPPTEEVELLKKVAQETNVQIDHAHVLGAPNYMLPQLGARQVPVSLGNDSLRLP